MKNMSKKFVSLLMIATLLMALFMPSRVNAAEVSRIGSSKVGKMDMSYTGGNSQVYVNKITKQDGTVVRYVYSSDFIVTPDTIAKLKSVLTSEYSSLIPDDYTIEDYVGIKVCSDPSLVDSMDENWTSSEWVGINVLATGEIKDVTNEDGDGLNSTAISNTHLSDAVFDEFKNNAENGNRIIWEQIELERKTNWDASEAAHHESDPTYTPQEYVASEYVPLDFGELTASDIENTRALEDNQIGLSVGVNLVLGYEFDGGKLNEIANVESVIHVASLYSSHTIIDDTESTAEIIYEYIDNTANQTYTINEDDALTFRINADFSLFENGGTVYVDGTETNEFVALSGSTVIIFAKDYVSSLSEGEHTLKVAFGNGGSATTTFTIVKANITTTDETETTETTSSAPKTGDNNAMWIWISLMVVSMLGVAGTVEAGKKSK